MTRKLKIEATGDFFARKVKPRIRLTGHWLARAGFPPGEFVEIVEVGPGQLTLRVVSTAGQCAPPPAFTNHLFPEHPSHQQKTPETRAVSHPQFRGEL